MILCKKNETLSIEISKLSEINYNWSGLSAGRFFVHTYMREGAKGTKLKGRLTHILILVTNYQSRSGQLSFI